MPQVAGFLLGAIGFGAPALGSAALGGWLAGGAIGSTLLGGAAVKLLTTVAVSALMSATMAPGMGGGGITISAPQHGEDKPETVIFGLYATAGQALYVNSHGKNNRYITYVVELCSAPGAQINKLLLDGDPVELGTTLHPDYGQPVLGEDYEGYAWLRYYDGSQTSADPMLVAQYAADPDYPWTSAMKGTGICYAILTFYYNAKHFNQLPEWLFEMKGVPVYDLRKDSTAGGSGSHRIGNPATWEWSDNPAVISYHIKRGYALPGGDVYGGRFAAADLRPTVWMPAMNACDQAVAISGSKTEKRYRCGLEVPLTAAPARALVELNKAMAAEVADVGGSWGIRVGAPALPIYWLQDRDVLVSRTRERDPFPSIDETFNGVRAEFACQAKGWETIDAPHVTNAAHEDRDAFGRRMADVSLPAVYRQSQVMRIIRALAKADRRFRRHILTLPPDAMILEPLDTLDFSSLRWGYLGKDFEISEIQHEWHTLVQTVSLLEVNAGDYDPDVEADDLPAPKRKRYSYPVDGWGLQAYNINGAAGDPRRVALKMVWDADITAEAIEWQIRRAGATDFERAGSTPNVEQGWVSASAGILPNTAYEARGRLVRRGQRTTWSDWVGAVTDNSRLTAADIAEGAVLPSNLAGWEAGNLCLDFDCNDPAYWVAGTGAVRSFIKTAQAQLGDRYLSIAPDAADRNVWGAWFAVRPGTEYLVQAAAWLADGGAGTGTCSVRMQFAEVDATGAIQNARYAGQITSRTDASYADAAHKSVILTTGATERRARFYVQRQGGGTKAGRAGGFIMRRRVDTESLGSNATGYDPEVYSASSTSAGSGVFAPGDAAMSWGGSAISMTVTDPSVFGKRITVTFSGECSLTRSAPGYAQGNISITVGSTSSADYIVRDYIATAGGTKRFPVSVTRRFVAPSVSFSVYSPFEVNVVGSDYHTVTMGLRFRSMAISVRKDDA